MMPLATIDKKRTASEPCGVTRGVMFLAGLSATAIVLGIAGAAQHRNTARDARSRPAVVKRVPPPGQGKVVPNLEQKRLEFHTDDGRRYVFDRRQVTWVPLAV